MLLILNFISIYFLCYLYLILASVVAETFGDVISTPKMKTTKIKPTIHSNIFISYEKKIVPHIVVHYLFIINNFKNSLRHYSFQYIVYYCVFLNLCR